MKSRIVKMPIDSIEGIRHDIRCMVVEAHIDEHTIQAITEEVSLEDMIFAAGWTIQEFVDAYGIEEVAE